MIKYKIEIPDNLNLENLKIEIKNGGRFIIYSYCISLVFAVTLKRISKAYFISPQQKDTHYKNKYNLINYFLGWWAISYGIIYTSTYIKLNNNGGINVTKDIMLNLDEEAIKCKEVKLEKIHSEFAIPLKNEIAEVRRSVTKNLPPHIKIERLIFGSYINVGDGAPFFVIGLETQNDFDESVVEIKKALYTRFFQTVPFEFTDLSEINLFNDRLAEQGFIII